MVPHLGDVRRPAFPCVLAPPAGLVWVFPARAAIAPVRVGGWGGCAGQNSRKQPAEFSGFPQCPVDPATSSRTAAAQLPATAHPGQNRARTGPVWASLGPSGPGGLSIDWPHHRVGSRRGNGSAAGPPHGPKRNGLPRRPVWRFGTSRPRAKRPPPGRLRAAAIKRDWRGSDGRKRSGPSSPAVQQPPKNRAMKSDRSSGSALPSPLKSARTHGGIAK